MRSGKTLYQSRVAERIWEDEHQFSVLDSSQKKRQTKKQGQTVSFCGTASRACRSEMHWISHARKRRNQFSKTIKFLLISLEILTQINLEYFTYCIFLGKKKKRKKKKASLLKQTCFKLRNRNILFKNTLAS